jgi:Na+/glutamate symporter
MLSNATDGCGALATVGAIFATLLGTPAEGSLWEP